MLLRELEILKTVLRVIPYGAICRKLIGSIFQVHCKEYACTAWSDQRFDGEMIQIRIEIFG